MAGELCRPPGAGPQARAPFHRMNSRPTDLRLRAVLMLLLGVLSLGLLSVGLLRRHRVGVVDTVMGRVRRLLLLIHFL